MNRRETRGAPPFFDHDWPAFVPDGKESKVSIFQIFQKQLTPRSSLTWSFSKELWWGITLTVVFISLIMVMFFYSLGSIKCDLNTVIKVCWAIIITWPARTFLVPKDQDKLIQRILPVQVDTGQDTMNELRVGGISFMEPAYLYVKLSIPKDTAWPLALIPLYLKVGYWFGIFLIIC